METEKCTPGHMDAHSTAQTQTTSLAVQASDGKCKCETPSSKIIEVFKTLQQIRNHPAPEGPTFLHTGHPGASCTH